MSKKFDRHEACPQCGSKNNVAVWSDGQKFCFSRCGYFVPGSSKLSREELRQRLESVKLQEEKNDTPHLPFDYTLALPEEPLSWLRQYGITDEERFRFKLGWSDYYESLILPAFDIWGNLLVVQRRYFGPENPRIPKYHTKGRPESVIWSVCPVRGVSDSDPDDTYNGDVVVVEDVISAIKVGRVAEATPLWGSAVSDAKLSQIMGRWGYVIYWLDHDKAATAAKLRQKTSVFAGSSTIVTEKDPKCYDDEHIRSLINIHCGRA